MLNIVLSVLIVISCLYSFFTGGAQELSGAILSSGTKAVELVLSIVGTMAVWGGIMNVAKDCGICDMITKLISPLIKRLFKGVDENSSAFKSISMNIVANMFGLGNAATPLGIKAMKELEHQENCKNTASRNMILLTVFNTSSIQLIPTTAAALRLAHGSKSPLEILPCVLIVSVAALAVSVICVYLFDGKNKRE